MPAYHSQFIKENEGRELCGFAVLPLKTEYKGPAPQSRDGADKEDIIDEAINCFKANVMFRNYEVQSAADRVLIYLTFYISQCIGTIRVTMSKKDCEQSLYQVAISPFAIPGDKTFVMAGFVKTAANRGESDNVKLYMQQLRQECGKRLTAAIYKHGDATPSKWWLCFSKRRFLNKSLVEQGGK